jgi:preprotein translocase SecE subunit
MGIRKYTGEVIREGKRVRWPNGDMFWPALAVVIIISVFAALILSLEDLAAATILNQLKEALKGIKG